MCSIFTGFARTIPILRELLVQFLTTRQKWMTGLQFLTRIFLSIFGIAGVVDSNPIVHFILLGNHNVKLS